MLTSMFKTMARLWSRSCLDRNCQCLHLISVSATYLSCARPISGQIV